MYWFKKQLVPIGLCKDCKHDFEVKEFEHYAGEPFVEGYDIPVQWEYVGKSKIHFKEGEYRLSSIGTVETVPKGGWTYYKEFEVMQPAGTHAKKQKTCENCKYPGKVTVDPCADCVYHEYFIPKESEPKSPEPVTTVTVWYDDTKDHTSVVGYKPYGKPDDALYDKGTYSFFGTPDIDHIIEEIKLGKPDGALVVKIECDYIFELKNKEKTIPVFRNNGLLIFSDFLGLPNDYFGNYDEYRFWLIDATGEAEEEIEQAITEYLKGKENNPIPSREKIKVGDVVFTSENEPALVVSVQGNTAWARTLFDMGNDSSTHYRNCNLRKATPNEVLDWFTIDVDGIPFIAHRMECGIKLRNNKISHIVYDDSVIGNEVSDMAVLDFIKRHVKDKVIPEKWVKALWPDGNVPYPKGK